jgi:hypothetical protein
VGEMFFAMVKKTMDLHVFPNLAFAFTIFASFDLWMFKGDLDMFSLVINFLNEFWNPMHVTVGLFEMNEING